MLEMAPDHEFLQLSLLYTYTIYYYFTYCIYRDNRGYSVPRTIMSNLI